MSCHDEFQIEIPAYVASRLTGQALSGIEEHLRGCEECREIADAWREIVPALREGGETVFEEHPLEMALREYALGEALHGGAIARHVEACASCELEVRFWKPRAGREAHSAPVAIPPRRWATAQSLWGAAAGLLAGIGVAYLTLTQGASPGADRRAATAGAPAITAISGRIPQVVLPRSVRGEGIERQVRIDAADRSLIVAAQLDLPIDADGGDRYRFAIEDGDGTTVWSTELDAAILRADLEANEVVSFVVPAGLLPAGRFTFVSAPAVAPGAPGVLSRATIVVTRSGW